MCIRLRCEADADELLPANDDFLVDRLDHRRPRWRLCLRPACGERPDVLDCRPGIDALPRQIVAQGGVILAQTPHGREERALVHPAGRDVEREFSPSTLDPAVVDRHDRVIGLHKGGHDGGNSGLVEAEPTDLRFKRREPRLAVPDLLRHALRAWLGRVDAAALATHEACRSDRRATDASQQAPQGVGNVASPRPAAASSRLEQRLDPSPKDVVNRWRLPPGSGSSLALSKYPSVVDGVLEDVVDRPVVHAVFAGEFVDRYGTRRVSLENADRATDRG
ncbi:MAG: hypothetical protein M3Q66_09600 [Chloroflexota bacterium]|nr:hypothetical protein [Chloroflexota bacterium]